MQQQEADTCRKEMKSCCLHLKFTEEFLLMNKNLNEGEEQRKGGGQGKGKTELAVL